MGAGRGAQGRREIRGAGYCEFQGVGQVSARGRRAGEMFELRVYWIAPGILGHDGYEGDRELCAATREREHHCGPWDPDWDMRSDPARHEVEGHGESGRAHSPRL